MPHSSGGGHGSFSGGSRIGGGHSANGSSSTVRTPQISNHRTSSTKHRYVRYHYGRPYYLYTDMPITKSDYVNPWMVGGIIGFAACLLLSFVFFLISYRFEVHKMPTNYTQNIVIQDDMHILENEKQLYDAMVEFKDLTGITPSFNSIYNYADESDLEDYAYNFYVRNFNDESHWLLVYSRNSNEWRFMGMQGDDTDDILDDYALDKFNHGLEKKLQNEMEVSDAFTEAFTEMQNYVMYHGVTNSLLHNLAYVFVTGTIGFLALLINTFRRSKKDKIIEIKGDLSEDQITDYCPHCNGEYVVGLQSTCPYCGSVINTTYQDVTYHGYE